MMWVGIIVGAIVVGWMIIEVSMRRMKAPNATTFQKKMDAVKKAEDEARRWR